jgi:hypothetical protein
VKRGLVVGLAVAAAACHGVDGAVDGSADVRFGAAVGYTAARAVADREGVIDLDPEADDARGFGAFAEAIAGDSLHLRLLYHRESDSFGGGIDADVEQALSFAMVGAGGELTDGLSARMLAGFGIGYTDLAFEPPVEFELHSGVTVALALGGEIVLGDHAVLGAMTWSSLFGELGDTFGVVDAGMAYVGFRF